MERLLIVTLECFNDAMNAYERSNSDISSDSFDRVKQLEYRLKLFIDIEESKRMAKQIEEVGLENIRL